MNHLEQIHPQKFFLCDLLGCNKFVGRITNSNPSGDISTK